MKSIITILALWLGWGTGVWAQELVKVELVLERSQYLPNESLPVGVRITNLSGQPLDFGKDNEWLSFSVEAPGSKPASKLMPMPVTGLFTAVPSARTTAKFDLAPYFDLAPGFYTVSATVRIKEWDQVYTSQPKQLDITKGSEVWQQEFGVPGSVGPSGGPPEIRKYILQQARSKDQLMLYLRVTDGQDRRVFKVIPLGIQLGFGQTQHQLDKFNNLHVMHQDGRQTCSYIVANPDGDIIVHQTYQITSQPKLRPGPNGLVMIAGGQRILSPTDLPKPPQEPPTADTRNSTP